MHVQTHCSSSGRTQIWISWTDCHVPYLVTGLTSSSFAPCSFISGTKSVIGRAVTGGKFFLDSLTSDGHSSSSGNPMTLKGHVTIIETRITHLIRSFSEINVLERWYSLKNLPQLVHFWFSTEQRPDRQVTAQLKAWNWLLEVILVLYTHHPHINCSISSY